MGNDGGGTDVKAIAKGSCVAVTATAVAMAAAGVAAVVGARWGGGQLPVDLRVAVLGNVDSGKSTLVGVLTGGDLDNGRGVARERVFGHAHEAVSGRTSAVTMHLMGFDAQGEPVTCAVGTRAAPAAKNKAWGDVVRRSDRLVTFIDLAGHEAYLRTTITGLSSSLPHLALILVNGLAGVVKMTREHIGLVLALEIPIVCVVTKLDMAPPNVLQRTMDRLTKVLKSDGARKMPVIVRSPKDAALCIQQLNAGSARVCPIVTISAVSGAGLPLLRSILSGLHPPPVRALATDWHHLAPTASARASASASPHSTVSGIDAKASLAAAAAAAAMPSGITPDAAIDCGAAINNAAVGSAAAAGAGGLAPVLGAGASPVVAGAASVPVVGGGGSVPVVGGGGSGAVMGGGGVEMEVDDHWAVRGIGLCVSGTVVGGEMREGARMKFGPDKDDASFCDVIVRSIHFKRVPVASCPAGLTCAVNIKSVKRVKGQLRRDDIRRGMLLLSHPPCAPDANSERPGVASKVVGADKKVGGNLKTSMMSSQTERAPDKTGRSGTMAEKSVDGAEAGISRRSLPSREFRAEVRILHHPTTIKRGYQAVVHCGAVRQTATIVSLDQPCLRTGDRAIVTFRFLARAEILRPGAPFLFCEGNTKGWGRVLADQPPSTPSPHPATLDATAPPTTTALALIGHKSVRGAETASATTK
jgi:GTPase